ncbi:tyrosine-type recombinase/integrase [Rosistilla oblonga]|uniref:Site-specific tyrosine recombinase XerC n=1 Tax=Rosistilla oblonga TaxID=2527990 RepID=A0A518IQW4_9BACT|nr:tyrosine-type recombinase/integrase [Rosistilla oblonga]QDV55487.1 site-specific tyrosine recombinase XerC [Rosistilla oblonga]
MAKSTAARRQRKDLKLSVHKASGYWCKVIAGHRYYFEKVADDPDGVESTDQLIEVRKGNPKPPRSGAFLIKDACEAWIQHKKQKLDAGEIVQDTWNEYHHTCEMTIAALGKETEVESLSPADFGKLRTSLAKRYGPTALGKHIGQVRSLFKHAYTEGLIDRPAKFGANFVKPKAKVLRKTRLEKGRQDFTAAEILAMLKVADPKWKSMILLGVQSGFGNRDVAELTPEVVDLKTGWIEYARSKTAIHRRVPLWPETIAAIAETIKSHPGGSPYLFVGDRGRDFTTENRTGGNRVSGAFKSVLNAAKLPTTGRTFYALRRTFQTQAEESGDLVAVRALMGHADGENDMSARYRQRVSDARLRRVVDTVHGWLYGGAK